MRPSSKAAGRAAVENRLLVLVDMGLFLRQSAPAVLPKPPALVSFAARTDGKSGRRVTVAGAWFNKPETTSRRLCWRTRGTFGEVNDRRVESENAIATGSHLR